MSNETANDQSSSSAPTAETTAQQQESQQPPQQQLTPEQLWRNVHQQCMAAVTTLKKTAHEQFHKGIEYFLGHLHEIISIQSEELTIFRAFESHARNQQMTEEVWTKFCNDMDAFRTRIQELNKQKAQELVSK